MTRDDSTDHRQPKTEVVKVGRSLTIQNAVQLVVILCFLAGFYYRTNDRLDAYEKAQQHLETIQDRQNAWLIAISIKLGVPPPPVGNP